MAATGSVSARVDGVGGAETNGPGQLPGIDVDRDHLAGPGQGGGRDGGVADPAATDHGDGVASRHSPGIDRGAESGHDAAADQACRLGASGPVDGDALTGRHQRLVGEGADSEGGRQRCAVGQGHGLGRVLGGEAVPGPASTAGAAGATRGPPGDDDIVVGRHPGHPFPDRLDRPGRLVAEQERELVVDRPFPVVQVGVADPAGGHLHHRLARSRIGDDDVGHLHLVAPRGSDNTANCLRHDRPSSVVGNVSPNTPV